MNNDYIYIDSKEYEFLENLKDNEDIVKIYFVNGICLEGKIISHDDNVIVIESKISTQYIYKSNITSINKALIDSDIKNYKY